MRISLPDCLRGRWHSFVYNFGWPDYVWLLDGWVAKCALAVPILGYLIVFNDTVAAHISFDRLAGESSSAFGLSASARLKCLYLGLLFLGGANVLYRWKRPYPMRIADNEFDYVERGIKHFPVSAYINFHGKIRHSEFDPYTRYGKYYDREWDDFIEEATGSRPGSKAKESELKSGHWNQAKSKHEGLLRSILIETFFRETYHTKLGWLVTGLLLAAVGYLFLAVPSADLFLKVLSLIFAPFASHWAS